MAVAGGGGSHDGGRGATESPLDAGGAIGMAGAASDRAAPGGASRCIAATAADPAAAISVRSAPVAIDAVDGISARIAAAGAAVGGGEGAAGITGPRPSGVARSGKNGAAGVGRGTGRGTDGLAAEGVGIAEPG